MATKTINLTGAEVAVTGLDGAHAHIRNDGTEVIYAAKTAGITAGADGVASIPAGQSDTIRGISGAVYLLGTGSVLIQSDDYVASPFKTSATSGGSGADEVARAAINTHSGNAEIHVTAEEKAAWNAVNYSNPNLLINPDFAINQYGITSVAGGTDRVYFADRWHSVGCSVTNSDGVISAAWDGSYIYDDGKNMGYIQSVLELPELIGKQVTLSINIDVVRHHAVFTIPTTFSGIVQEEISEDIDIAVGNYANIGIAAILFLKSTINHIIGDFKLELGGIATPFVPPDPATELAKCQRYYQIRSTGDIAAVDLRPTMRDTPTITQLSDGNYAYSAEL